MENKPEQEFASERPISSKVSNKRIILTSAILFGPFLYTIKSGNKSILQM